MLLRRARRIKRPKRNENYLPAYPSGVGVSPFVAILANSPRAMPGSNLICGIKPELKSRLVRKGSSGVALEELRRALKSA
jgi:hypothetical protein